MLQDRALKDVLVSLMNQSSALSNKAAATGVLYKMVKEVWSQYQPLIINFGIKLHIS